MLAALVVIVGCDLGPVFILPPAGMTEVPGGIGDVRPYYGRTRSADVPDQELGDFLLASCGCGDWRALIAPDDGSENASVVVRFYTVDAYVPTGSVTIHADEEGGALRGTVDQDNGQTEGRLQLGPRRMFFEATRGENHLSSAEACLMCHLGEQPIWPLPDTHTTDYQLDPPNCLDCHELN
jgi:hypothetical protein